MPDPSDLCLLADVKAWIPNLTGTTSDALLASLITRESRYIANWLQRPLLTMAYTEKRNGTGQPSLALLRFPAFAVNSLSIYTAQINSAPTSLTSGYLFDENFVYVNGLPSIPSSTIFAFSPVTFERGQQNIQIQYSAGYMLPNQANPQDWSGTTAVAFGATIRPTSNNAGGYVYVCTIAGTTSASRPQFSQTPGASTSDGTAPNAVVWTNLGVTALPASLPSGPTNELPPDITQACVELVGLRYRERERIGQTSQHLDGQTIAYFQRGSMPPSVEDALSSYKNVAPVY